jgi:DNA polymerase V
MTAMDTLNACFGRHTVFPAGMGAECPWKLRAEHRSLRYTTRLVDVPVIWAI